MDIHDGLGEFIQEGLFLDLKFNKPIAPAKQYIARTIKTELMEEITPERTVQIIPDTIHKTRCDFFNGYSLMTIRN